MMSNNSAHESHQWRIAVKEEKILFWLIPLIFIGLIVGLAAADRLPNETPENQVFTMTSAVEAIGSYTGAQSQQWTTGYDPEPSLFSNFPTDPTDSLVMSYKNWGPALENWDTFNNFYHESYLVDNPNGNFYGYINWLIIHGGPQMAQETKDLLDYLTANTETTGYGGHGGLHTGILDPNEVRATTAYSEMTQTNGGYLSETKSFDPDSRNKALGLYNVESTKTLTYATDANTGSIAQNYESITLDVMANSTLTSDVVACPFGPSTSTWFPAFCNVVYAKSMSQGVTSAAMSSSAQVGMIAASADTPAELNYNFDVKPDASSDIGYAMGTFGTEFGVSIKEARGNNMTPSVLNVYTDKATVAGMVAKFTKQYAYKSGFKL
jgi:hypothetical protein